MKSNKIARVIALYLPQYHPIPENDEWWGKGFTEWTNVGRAKPFFKGHYQPKVPADLGYYDLRLPQIREAQAEMAKEAGIEGFCYYHYWFDTNKQLLERPFNEVLESGSPDFPFMVCWANESWHAKLWNVEGVSEKKILIEQKYGTQDDQTIHFNHLLKAFKDRRYIKIDGKPAFMIYKPLEIPEVKKMLNLWQILAKENGLPGIFFIGSSQSAENQKDQIFNLGFDAVNAVRLFDILKGNKTFFKAIKKLYRLIYKMPHRFEYAKVQKTFISEQDSEEFVFPTIIPNWDHTPRSGKNGYVLTGSEPMFFEKHLENCFSTIKNKNNEHKIVFLKSWNEWGEGNYVEPDLKYGKSYLMVLKKMLCV